MLLVVAIFMIATSTLAGIDPVPSSVVVDLFNDVPVDMASGEVTIRENPDFAFAARELPFVLQRNYKSRRELDSPFGFNWSWTHNDHLIITNYDPVTHIKVVTEDSVFDVWKDHQYINGWAMNCNAFDGPAGKWENEDLATGPFDFQMAETPGWYTSLTSNLYAWGWTNVVAPDGIPDAEITKVELIIYAATPSAGPDKMRLQLGFYYDRDLTQKGSKTLDWAQIEHGWFTLDITDTPPPGQGSWDWDDFSTVVAELSHVGHIPGANTMTVVDTFMLRVTYKAENEDLYACPPGAQFSFAKDGSDYVMTGFNKQKTVFDSDGRLIRKETPNGNQLAFSYDASDRMTNMTDQTGQKLNFFYQNPSLPDCVTKVTDHLGRQCSYAYDTYGNLTTVTDLIENVWSYDYLSGLPNEELNHNMSSMTDPMDQTVEIAYVSPTNNTVAWQVECGDNSGKPFVGDFNGDSKWDIGVLNPANDSYEIKSITTGYWETNGFSALGYDNYTPVPGDYDGDGKDDIAIYDYTKKKWAIRFSSTGSFSQYDFGVDNAVPLQGDYTSNGKCDLAYYNPADGDVYVKQILPSVWDAVAEFPVVSSITTVRGNYNSNSRFDFCAFDTPNGVWHIVTELGTSGCATNSYTHDLYGAHPVSGDYDKDGVYDLGLFNPSTGEWKIKSVVSPDYFSTNTITTWVPETGNGIGMAGDFDGNGKTDLAIYDPDTSKWYIFNIDYAYYDVSEDRVAQFTDKLGRKVWFKAQDDVVFSGIPGDDIHQAAVFNSENDIIRTYVREGDVYDAVTDDEVEPEDRNYIYGEGHLLSAVIRNGYTNSFLYDARNNMIKRTDAAGAIWQYEYETDFNKQVSFTGPLGNSNYMLYDDKGNLTNNIDAATNTTVFKHDTYGNVTNITDCMDYSVSYVFDANGINVLQQKNKMGGISTYTYDNVGNLLSETDPNTNTVSSSYNAYNQKIYETNQIGRVTRYYYDALGRPTNTVVGSKSISYVYDAAGRKIQTIDAMTNSSYAYYDNYNNQTSAVDRLDNTTVMIYDRYGRMIREIDPLGYAKTLAYDGSGNVIAIVDRLGRVSKSTFDGRKQLVRSEDAFGNIVTFEYDLKGNKIKETIDMKGYEGCSDAEDPEPLIVVYEYDNLDQLTKKTVGYGTDQPRINTSEYDALGREIKTIDPSGAYKTAEYNSDSYGTNVCIYNASDELKFRTTITYDGVGQKLMEIAGYVDGFYYTNIVEYEARGLKSAEIGPRGARTTYYYDQYGKLTNAVDALNNKSHVEYDLNGNPIRETSPNGLITETHYDAEGRITNKVIGVNTANPVSMFYTYNDRGEVLTEIDPYGYTTSFEYDAEGNKTRITGKNGHSVTMTYDVLNRSIESTDPFGYSESKLVDGRGNAWYTINKMGITNAMTYDIFGQLISVTDPAGATVTYEYDAMGWKTKEVNPLGLETIFNYDSAGRVTNKVIGVNTVNPVIFKTEYDPFGRPITETDPYGNYATTEYDANGNVIRTIDKRGAETEFYYDILNRLTNTIDALEYEAQNEYDVMGNITKVIDPLENETTFTYDLFGRKTEMANPYNHKVYYHYDLLGRLTNETDHYGNASVMVYDPLGNVTLKIDKNGNHAWFNYDALNRVTNTVDALGYTTSKQYDPMGRVVTAKDKRGYETDYTYDDRGLLTVITDPSGASLTNVYDIAGQKIKEIDPSGTESIYYYDILGRLTRKDVGSNRSDTRIWKYVYDKLGRMTAETDPMGNTAYVTYDANGNKLVETNKRGYQNQYQYDAINRMTNMTDAAGNKVSKVYDPLGNVLAMTDKRGNTTTNAFDDAARIISITDPKGNTSRFEYDALGNKIREINPMGVTTRFDYDPLGFVTNKVIAEGESDARTQSAVFDALGRQVKAIDPLGAYVVTQYDPNGNVTNSISYSASGADLRNTVSEYNELNMVTNKIDPKGNVYKVEYDIHGWKTADIDPQTNRVEYTYDDFGNVIKTTDPLGYETQTQYDKLNRAVKTINALGYQSTVEYDENGNVVKQTDDNGNSIYMTYDELDQLIEKNESMPETVLGQKIRADVNGDGLINSADIDALNAVINP